MSRWGKEQSDADAQADQAAGEQLPPLSARDAEVLHAALARVCRLLGYNDPFMPEHVADLDATGVDERIAGLVAFAKTAKLP
jgi:hypothetical protein